MAQYPTSPVLTYSPRRLGKRMTLNHGSPLGIIGQLDKLSTPVRKRHEERDFRKADFGVGGDDCKLEIWDLRQGVTTPTFTYKGYDAGVTTIQSNPHVEHQVAVGR